MTIYPLAVLQRIFARKEVDKRMRIEESLPVDICVNCKRFVLNVNEQIFLYQTGTERVIKVTCGNERNCSLVKQRLKELEDAKQ